MSSFLEKFKTAAAKFGQHVPGLPKQVTTWGTDGEKTDVSRFIREFVSSDWTGEVKIHTVKTLPDSPTNFMVQIEWSDDGSKSSRARSLTRLGDEFARIAGLPAESVIYQKPLGGWSLYPQWTPILGMANYQATLTTVECAEANMLAEHIRLLNDKTKGAPLVLRYKRLKARLRHWKAVWKISGTSKPEALVRSSVFSWALGPMALFLDMVDYNEHLFLTWMGESYNLWWVETAVIVWLSYRVSLWALMMLHLPHAEGWRESAYKLGAPKAFDT
jgi:hypothetical protein